MVTDYCYAMIMIWISVHKGIASLGSMDAFQCRGPSIWLAIECSFHRKMPIVKEEVKGAFITAHFPAGDFSSSSFSSLGLSDSECRALTFWSSSAAGGKVLLEPTAIKEGPFAYIEQINLRTENCGNSRDSTMRLGKEIVAVAAFVLSILDSLPGIDRLPVAIGDVY